MPARIRRRARRRTMTTWTFVHAGPEGQPAILDGVDVWKHTWQRVPGEVASVTDPHYGQTFQFSVYRVTEAGRVIEFAAGEFSNSVWGFFQKPKRARGAR